MDEDFEALRRRLAGDAEDLDALWQLARALERAGRLVDAYLLCIDRALFPDPDNFRSVEQVKRRTPAENWDAIEDHFFADQPPAVRERQRELEAFRERLAERLADQQRRALTALIELEEASGSLRFSFDFESTAGYGREALELRLPVLEILMYAEPRGLRAFFRGSPLWRRLTGSRAALDDEAMALLPELSTLRSLVLPRSRALSRSGLRAIARSRSLTAIAFDNTDLLSGDLAELAPLAQLRKIEVSGCPWVRDRDLEALAGALPELRRLHLHGTSLTRAILPRLAAIPRLEALSIGPVGLTVADLEALAERGRLKSLSLSEERLEDSLFELLARLPLLEELDLGSAPVTASSLAPLVRCGRLKSLSFFDSQVDDEALAILAGLPALERLELDRCRCISAAGLQALAACPRLKRVSVSHSGVHLEELERPLPSFHIDGLPSASGRLVLDDPLPVDPD